MSYEVVVTMFVYGRTKTDDKISCLLQKKPNDQPNVLIEIKPRSS